MIEKLFTTQSIIPNNREILITFYINCYSNKQNSPMESKICEIKRNYLLFDKHWFRVHFIYLRLQAGNNAPPIYRLVSYRQNIFR